MLSSGNGLSSAFVHNSSEKQESREILFGLLLCVDLMPVFLVTENRGTCQCLLKSTSI